MRVRTRIVNGTCAASDAPADGRDGERASRALHCAPAARQPPRLRQHRGQAAETLEVGESGRNRAARNACAWSTAMQPGLLCALRSVGPAEVKQSSIMSAAQWQGTVAGLGSGGVDMDIYDIHIDYM